MEQNIYCSEIKRRAILFLNMLNQEDRACELANMPTEITTIAPCWGMNKETAKMTHVLDCLAKPLEISDFARILEISGTESIINAAPELYPFLTGKPIDLSRL